MFRCVFVGLLFGLFGLSFGACVEDHCTGDYEINLSTFEVKDGARCSRKCDCNNQKYSANCKMSPDLDQNGKTVGICSIFYERRNCQVNHTETCLEREVDAKYLSFCQSRTYVRKCGSSGLKSLVWGDCHCDGSVCTDGQIVCNRSCTKENPCECVDLKNNVQHCGSCGKTCHKGEFCHEGICVCQKKEPKICNQECVDLKSDTNHCGQCGNRCPDQSSCVEGQCVCSDGLVICNNTCVDLQGNSQHCGGCGVTCPDHGQCYLGKCKEILIQPGSYVAGTPFTSIDWDEQLIFWQFEQSHTVTLTRPIYAWKHEITQKEYLKLMKENPSEYSVGDHYPVHGVTNKDAKKYCNALSKYLLKLPEDELCYKCDDKECDLQDKWKGSKGKDYYNCKAFRLPTEAEWEYLCRAGSSTDYYNGNMSSLFSLTKLNFQDKLLDEIAWYLGNPKGDSKPKEVGLLKPNTWGLYDMLGNVGEIVFGRVNLTEGHKLYTSVTDPIFVGGINDGELSGYTKGAAYRGGTSFGSALFNRCAFRLEDNSNKEGAAKNSGFFGFRVIRTAPIPSPCQTSNGVCEPGRSCCPTGCQDTLNDSKNCGQCGNICPDAQVCRQGRCVAPDTLIFAGSFFMGSHDGKDNEKPVNYVTLTHDFKIWKHEVTQLAFRSLMGYLPVEGSTCVGVSDHCPVDQVTWHEAVAFANRLSKKDGLEECFVCRGEKTDVRCELKPEFQKNDGKDYYKCKGYRLPTEAEWEYAARAGNPKKLYGKGKWPWDDIGWFKDGGNQRNILGEVMKKRPNLWGLFDMLGNVQEWVFDGYTEKYPEPKTTEESKKLLTDPIKVPDEHGIGKHRVLRGGSIGEWAEGGISFSLRNFGDPGTRGFSQVNGFRVVRTVERCPDATSSKHCIYDDACEPFRTRCGGPNNNEIFVCHRSGRGWTRQLSCQTGENCVQGLCVPKTEHGNPCQTDDDCKNGPACNPQDRGKTCLTCIDPNDGTGKKCLYQGLPRGRVCFHKSECEQDHPCHKTDFSTVPKRCLVPGNISENASCYDSFECIEHLQCRNQCQSPAPSVCHDEDRCSLSIQCRKNTCIPY